MHAGTAAEGRIDGLMAQAEEALSGTDYYRTNRLCAEALRAAYLGRDYDRMARIVLPLQEAARQIRERAADLGPAGIVDSPQAMRGPLRGGCYLVQPPLVGVDGRMLRERALRRGVPVLVVTREPATASGRWPVVAVGSSALGAAPAGGLVVVRAQVDPPGGTVPAPSSPTGDRVSGSPEPSWFLAAVEGLGVSARGRVKAEDPASWRVDDLMGLLDAHPDDEILHQMLGRACRDALHESGPGRPRPREDGDPYSF